MTGSGAIVVASNRGPVALSRDDDGSIVEKRGVGGLVTAVGGALVARDGLWVAAAMTDEDRAQAGADPYVLEQPSGTALRVRFVDIDPDTYDGYYNHFANRIVWFLHHQLWAPGGPAFGDRDTAAWEAYRSVNERFARLLAADAPADASVLPQDYHFSLVPALLREARPELPISMFWHIPFCTPEQFAVLGAWGNALLEGMLGADIMGFHTGWWASNFAACCATFLGATVDGDAITHRRHTTRVRSYPIGVDVQALRADAASDAAVAAARDIDAITAGRTLILRVDRTELSKNILRGLVAYGGLLERRPDLHEKVVHLVLLSPSRGDIPEYQEYTRACRARAERINRRYGTAGWTPVVLEIADDFMRTLAAYRRYDVLLVNPVFDGMNLVAREGPVLNERDGVLVLSGNAGAAHEIGTNALIVNPYDARDTVAALEHALDMLPTERAERAARLREIAPGDPPETWLDQQLNELSRVRAS